MDDRRFDHEPDELESLLAESLSAPPPDSLITEITPWRQAMNRALTGLALASVTLNFLWLDYLLPSVSYIQLLLGLRVLRRENGFFKTWWAVNLVRSGWWFFCLLRNAVPGSQSFFALAPFKALRYVFLALQFVQLFCLWRGLKAIQRKAGLTPQSSGGGLIVWNLIVVGLGLMGYSGWLLGLPVLIAYVCIFRGLYRLSKELDEAGYAVRTAPVRMPDQALVRGITAVLIAGLLFCYLFLNRFPMDWKPVDPAEHSQAAELEAKLLELGFPEEVLADLAPEDLLACEGALRVVSDVFEYPRDDYRDSPDEVTLRITGVAVELEGEREKWRIFHHFTLLEKPRRGTYAIQLWPTWKLIYEGWAPSERPTTGRVLYDKGGTAYASPYYFLDSETYTADTFFWGQQTSTDVFASFSLPRSGENHRGYVSYETVERRNGYIIDSWCNFVQPTGWFQYPVRSAQEWRMAGYWNGESQPFRYIQSALQFYPRTVDEEGVF